MKKLKERKYFEVGLTIFWAGCALILFYFLMFNYKDVLKILSVISSVLTPFFLGIALAYIMCPIYNFITKRLYRGLRYKLKTDHNAIKLSKIISTLITMIILIGIIVGFFLLIIPDLIKTVTELVNVLPTEFEHVSDWFNNLASTKIKSSAPVIANLQDGLLSWVNNKLIPSAGDLVAVLSEGIYDVFKFIFNFIAALVACIYFLNGKEHFLAQIKKIILAVFSENKAGRIFEIGETTHKTFGGFVNGKIIDSFIVGIICFVAMTILGLPYPVLISLVIGLTNVIPFFGPFIGGIPSALLILLVNPMDALYFSIMILVLQQFDGSFLGPKIMGNKIGLSSFWVMFAILTFGGLFGFIGMVLGTPIFALIYTYFGEYIKNRLKKKKLPDETEIYEVNVLN